MSSYSELVDELRSRLDGEQIVLDDELQAIAERYAVACREVNRRLQRCEEFLRRELRAEAIQYAESDPPLLDAVAVLDFPEVEEWRQAVSLYELPRADPLLLGISEALNEAYSLHAPLDSLLRQHRRLALARAPLFERMNVLRTLVARDPGANVWEENLCLLEKARLRQIEEHHRGWGSIDELTTVIRELGLPSWRMKPSPELMRSVKQQLVTLKRQRGIAACRALEPRLGAAFGELDIGKARELRGYWEAAASDAKLSADDPLMRQVAPVFGWLDDVDAADAQEAEFQSLVQELEMALDRDRPIDELERLATSIYSRLQRDIPEPLGSRYRSKVASLQLSTTRKRTLMIGGGVAAVVALAVFAVILVRAAVEVEQIRKVTASVESMLHDGQIQEARKLYDQHKDFSPTDAWLAVGKELVNAERQEQDRLQRFADTLQLVNAAEVAATVESALVELDGLARNSGEKSAAEKARQGLMARDRAMRQTAEDDWRAVIAEVSAATQELDLIARKAASQDEIRDISKRVSERLAQLATLEPMASFVSTSSGAQRKLLQQRLNDILTLNSKESSRIVREQELDRLIERMRTPTVGAVEEIAAYTVALEKYVVDFPQAACSQDYRKVSAERSRWESATAWSKLTATWKTLVPPLANECRNRIDSLNEFVQEHQGAAEASIALEYRDFLSSVVQRFDAVGDDKTAAKQVLEVFQRTLVKDVHVLKDRKGRLFYITEPYKWDGKSTGANFKYYSNAAGRTKNLSIIIDQLDIKSSILSPQAVLSQMAAELLKSRADFDWLVITERIASGIFDTPDMDVLLRQQLLLDLLAPIGAGDAYLRKELEPFRSRLEDPRIDAAARWMDPDDEESPPMRKIAAELLEELKADFLASWTKSREHQKTLSAKLQQHWVPAGRLVKTQDGKWTVATSLATGGNVRLGILPPSAEQFVPIARLSMDGVEPKQIPASPLLMEGRLVFAQSVPSAD